MLKQASLSHTAYGKKLQWCLLQTLEPPRASDLSEHSTLMSGSLQASHSVTSNHVRFIHDMLQVPSKLRLNSSRLGDLSSAQYLVTGRRIVEMLKPPTANLILTNPDTNLSVICHDQVCVASTELEQAAFCQWQENELGGAFNISQPWTANY